MEITPKQFRKLLKNEEPVYINDNTYRRGDRYELTERMFAGITEDKAEMVYCYAHYIPFITPLTREVVSELVESGNEEILTRQLHAIDITDSSGLHWAINGDDLARFYGCETVEFIIVTCGDECCYVGEFK